MNNKTGRDIRLVMSKELVGGKEPIQPRIEGIDYLRAIMSIFVVVWHMGGGGRSLVFSNEMYLEHVFSLSDFVNFHLLLLAVPTFIFVSIFLYASRPVSIPALKKRFARVFILLTFWPIALTLYNKGYQGLADMAPGSPFEAIFTILRAGDTIYYFFASLIVCLFISHLFLLLGRKLQLSVFIISVVFLASLPQLTKMTGFFPLSAYWNPLNFIPLSFAAVLVAKNKAYILKNKKFFVLASVVLCVFFSMLEWKYSVGEIFFPGQGYAIPAYTRASLLFGVLAIFVVSLSPGIKANGVIRHMSEHSLALYCLHPFLAAHVMKVASGYFQNEIAALYVSIMVVIALSYFMAMLLRRYYLKDTVVV